MTTHSLLLIKVTVSYQNPAKSFHLRPIQLHNVSFLLAGWCLGHRVNRIPLAALELYWGVPGPGKADRGVCDYWPRTLGSSQERPELKEATSR